MIECDFGFLASPIKGDFLDVSITPRPNHSEILDALKEVSHRDGFYYPPKTALYEVDFLSKDLKDKIERSERPASMFFMPPSHHLSIQNPICASGDKGTDTTLLIFLLAYLYGTRLMPSNWKFDGRVPIESVNNIYITTATTFDFLEQVYTWWKNLSKSLRVKFVNILYVFNRARSLEWEWDSFIHQYMVFDALYNFHLELQPNMAAKGHKDRFRVLCNAYSVFNEDSVERIYTARNNLVHEAMWVGSTIGFGSADVDAYQLPFHLARLNTRIIAGISGYQNQYIRSPWWYMGTFSFDKKI